MRYIVSLLMVVVCFSAFPAQAEDVKTSPPHKVPFIYYLQNINRQLLIQINPAVAVIDPYDSGLEDKDVGFLQRRYGQTLLAYLSVGEVDTLRESKYDGYAFRPEWRNAYWYTRVPEAIRENETWGSRRVEYWNPEWRAILLFRARKLVEKGYDGMMLDTVDTYLEMEEHYRQDIRQNMTDLVARLAREVREMNPGFKVYVNNAMGLYDYKESRKNTPYLEIIDGQLKEDTWYNETGFIKESWTDEDLAYMRRAVGAGKPVFAIDYFTGKKVGAPNKQRMSDFMIQARTVGAIPFAADRELGRYLSYNEEYYTDKFSWDSAKKVGVMP